jgi:diacylglycerol kinase family enzyme
MYYYIYDAFLAEKKFERLVAAMETRITDLGISGKIGRLTPFQSARGLIRDEVKRGMQTIVAVGNDETVAKVVEALGDAKVTLGIIPVGGPCEIAHALGIPEGIEACDILSKRVTQTIDLGSVNGRYFLSSLRVPAGVDVSLESTSGPGATTFRVSALAPDTDIIISNLRASGPVAQSEGGYCVGDPMDGWLDVLFEPRAGARGGSGFLGLGGLLGRRNQGTPGVIPLRSATITCPEPMTAVADGKEFTGESLTIEVVPDRLRVITGRERVFAA